MTITTAEVETICLKNGVLFHELLSSFGHLDGINTTVRAGNQNFYLPDAHIRFERNTEVKLKSADLVEKLLNTSFEEYDINRLPTNLPELKASPPSAWNHKLERIITHGLSFFESEMFSNPLIILSVISSSDIDHIASMQELISAHHCPTCYSTGQYDPSIHRIYLLLHDASDNKNIDPIPIYKKLQSKFPPISTKLLVINSLSSDSPNLQQPDMWSRFLLPRFFPHFAPVLESNNVSIPNNPITGMPVYGSRLSMEDFMAIREFCVLLYNQEIVPCLERKFIYLHKQVNDTRKGMKNVLKSFWRKPKDESEISRGGVKYKFDKIESQMLHLADLSFIVKDYETALSTYKLVRDDFKSDKSQLHLAHTSLMIVICQIITEPNKLKDIFASLDSLNQVLITISDLPHVNAFYSLMMAEMYVFSPNGKQPTESARVLLQAASTMTKQRLMAGLYTEKAATFFLSVGQVRKYLFHEVFAGNKIHQLGLRQARHSDVCFASCMLLLDQTSWGDLKSKLTRALSQDFKYLGRSGAQRSLLLMMKMMFAIFNETKDVGNNSSMGDAINVYHEIVSEGAWGSISVAENWADLSTRDILLSNNIPIATSNNDDNSGKQKTIVGNFGIPYLNKERIFLVQTLNGRKSGFTSEDITEFKHAEELYTMLELERVWMLEQTAKESSGTAINNLDSQNTTTLSDRWAEAEYEMNKAKSNKYATSLNISTRIPLGEDIKVSLSLLNKLPVDIKLSKLKVKMEPDEGFSTKDIEISLHSNLSTDVSLVSTPTKLGFYKVSVAEWSLSDFFSVKQALVKDGPLLQKSLQNRLNRDRGEDKSLYFEVIQSHPLLKISFEGLSPEVLQGQLLKATLVIKNEGAASASNIFIKLSQPSFVFLRNSSDGITDTPLNSRLIKFFGRSSTIVKLDDDTIIEPGQEVKYEAWLRITKPGLQTISLLLSYMARRPDGSTEYFGPGNKCRTSFISIQTKGLPSIGTSLSILSKPTSITNFTLLTDISNYMKKINDDHITEEIGNRESSVGQIDIANLENDIFGLDENSMKIVGTWMLGCAEPYSDSRKSNDVDRKPMVLLASPAEKNTICFPIKLNYDNNGMYGKSSWLLPFWSECEGGNDQEKALRKEMMEIIEQFLCIQQSSDLFEKEIQESRDMIVQEEMEADSSGPRTISQVRRDRQKADSVDKIEENHVFDLKNESMDIYLDPSQSAIGTTKHQSMLSSSTTLFCNAQNIADKEANNNSILISFIWMIRWHGKIRWGMHVIPNLSFISKRIVSSIGENTKSLYATVKSKLLPTDYLLVGLYHPHKLDILETGLINIVVKIKSLYGQPMLISAKSDEKKISNIKDNSLIWTCMRQYSNQLLLPYGEIQIKFSVIVSNPGIYDINRFVVSACYYKDRYINPPRSFVKYIDGESLVVVTRNIVTAD